MGSEMAMTADEAGDRGPPQGRVFHVEHLRSIAAASREIESLRRLRAGPVFEQGLSEPVQRQLESIQRSMERWAAASGGGMDQLPEALRQGVVACRVDGSSVVIEARSAGWRKRIGDWLRRGGEAMVLRASSGAKRVRVVLAAADR